MRGHCSHDAGSGRQFRYIDDASVIDADADVEHVLALGVSLAASALA